MELETRFFGKIEINKEEIIRFPQGLPGFLDKKDYYLMTYDKESPFFVLQSVEEKDLAFITVPPWHFFKDYEFELSDRVQELLEIESQDDVLVLVIGTIPGKVSGMTINLAAPLVINHRKCLGKQLILDKEDYPVRQPVLNETVKQEAK
ncbi:MAG TPA: flagellar assembly protein FliW [Halanaerobiales bacterium]|nr:flagellar assembly protein FliW [Halanaerobiales bacterium]